MDFTSLQQRARRQDPTLDLSPVRESYAADPDYQPYQRDKKVSEVLQLIEANPSEAKAFLAQRLERNYLDVEAHELALYLAARTQDAKAKAEHAFMMSLSLAAILDGRMGDSPAQAWKVLDTREEYATLRAAQLKSVAQALVREGDRSFDRHIVRDSSGKQREVYFDVTWPQEFLARGG